MAQQLTAETAQGDRPALILDIDGVFIVSGKVKPRLEGYVNHPHFDWDVYNPDHGKWLKDVTDNLADAYYISDSEGLSHWTIGQHFGVAEFDWIKVNDYAARRKAASRAIAISALFGGRPLAWIDDMIDQPERRWSQERTATEAPTLVVKTQKEQGLRPAQMKRVTKWLERLTDQSASQAESY